VATRCPAWARHLRGSTVTDRFQVSAIRAPGVSDSEARRRLGRAYALILQYGAKKEPADPSKAAEISQPSTVGDTLTAEPEDQ